MCFFYNFLLASCPWGSVTDNGVDVLTEMYVIYMERNTSHGAIARSTSPCILHTFESANQSHGQWPAPMGSWRVQYYGRYSILLGDNTPLFWARVWYTIQVVIQEILDCTLKWKWLLCLETFQLLSRSINSIKHIITITQSANLVALYLKCLHLAERSQARYFLIKHGLFVHVLAGEM